VRPGGVRLAEGYVQRRQRPFSQSNPAAPKRDAHAHLHIVTFSNYRVRLKEAILAIRALKKALSNDNHNSDGKNDCRLANRQKLILGREQ
jgi:hypothetical protein